MTTTKGLLMNVSPSAERKTIESLRAGTPTSVAVEMLGSQQEDIEEDFFQLTGRIRTRKPGGMLVSGGFGAGKSHLLRHLSLLARHNGFVVSHVVVSKETPLYDPVKVAATALDSAVLPAGGGPAIEHVAASLDTEGTRFAELLRWAASPSTGLDERFPASLLLFARLRGQDDDFRHAIVRFWSGEALSTPDLRRHLRAANERMAFRRVSPAELARQRLRFAARLMVAAGHPGWLIFFDEVELIARYTVNGRIKAYAEVHRWFTGDHGDRNSPIGAVMALTDDFSAVMFDGKGDRERLPQKLRADRAEEADQLAKQAESGMDAIRRETKMLAEPDDEEMSMVYTKLKQLYETAFNCSVPAVSGLPRDSSIRIRQYIRAWINEWDLVRLDPSAHPISTYDPAVSKSGRTAAR